MEDVIQWLQWAMENQEAILAKIGSIVIAASVFVKLTPTDIDNKMLAAVQKVLNFLAINPKTSKEK